MSQEEWEKLLEVELRSSLDVHLYLSIMGTTNGVWQYKLTEEITSEFAVELIVEPTVSQLTWEGRRDVSRRIFFHDAFQ